MFKNANMDFENDCLDLTGMNLSHVLNADNMLSFYSSTKAKLTSMVFPDDAFSFVVEGKHSAISNIFGFVPEEA